MKLPQKSDTRDLASSLTFIIMVLVAWALRDNIVPFLYLFDEQPSILPSVVAKIENLYMALAIVTSGAIATTVYLKMTLVHQARNLAEEMMADLLLSREQFRMLYDSSPIPYFLLDIHGVVHNPNKATLRFFGGTEAEVTQIAFFDMLFDDSGSSTSLAVLKSKADHGVAISREEVQIHTINKQRRWVQISVFAMDQHAPLAGMRLVSMVDVTEAKEMDRIKTDFVSLASHQLRTPLTAVKWNIDLLLTSNSIQVSDEVKGYLHKIYTGNERMIDLVSTLLNVSRIEMGTVPVDISEVSLRDLGNDVIDEVRKAAEDKSLELLVRLEAAGRATTDKNLIRIAIQNLLTNAIRYTPEHGSVTFSIESNAHGHRIDVADTGVGIPPEAHDKLFTKMFRADNARKMEAKGTGLGLYMTKAFVEQVGGTIEYKSVFEKGTTFTILLPNTPTVRSI